MKIGTVVKNEYQGITRYGKVSMLSSNHEDGWTWCEVDWIDDEQYQDAIAYRNKYPTKTTISLSTELMN